MSDLTAFLLARIDEDEADSYRIHDLLDDKYTWPVDLAGCPCGVPARVLAEVAAKRRIVELHADDAPGLCDELLALASVYATHPDFRDEWRV